MFATITIVALSFGFIASTCAQDPCGCEASLNASRVIAVEGVQETIFGVMTSRYESVEDVLTLGLGLPVDNVGEDRFKILCKGQCMRGTATDVEMTVDGNTYVVDITLSGHALVQGVSTAICDCYGRLIEDSDSAESDEESDVCDFIKDAIDERMDAVQALFA